jgi:hypothetical protein
VYDSHDFKARSLEEDERESGPAVYDSHDFKARSLASRNEEGQVDEAEEDECDGEECEERRLFQNYWNSFIPRPSVGRHLFGGGHMAKAHHNGKGASIWRQLEDVHV